MTNIEGRVWPLGPLHGIPFSTKDLMAVANVPYASGSRAMANNVAAVDAPAVERAKAAGAILIGKTTTSEFLEVALAQEMPDYYAKVFERYVFREKLRTFFEHYDALVSPVVPVSSLDVGVNIPSHLIDRNLVSWVYYTYPFNLTGQPAATICAGLGDGGMPVGLQIVGRSLGEFDVVRLACAFEKATANAHFE